MQVLLTKAVQEAILLEVQVIVKAVRLGEEAVAQGLVVALLDYLLLEINHKAALYCLGALDHATEDEDLVLVLVVVEAAHIFEGGDFVCRHLGDVEGRGHREGFPLEAAGEAGCLVACLVRTHDLEELVYVEALEVVLHVALVGRGQRC